MAIDYEGAMDDATDEIITFLKDNYTFWEDWEFLTNESQINLDPDNVTDIPSTPPPFVSVHLGHRKKDPDAGNTGGDRINFLADGRIIIFIPPHGDPEMPSLNFLGEKADHILKKADNQSDFDIITDYKFMDHYLRPYMLMTNTGRTKVADTVTIEFIIGYEAIV